MDVEKFKKKNLDIKDCVELFERDDLFFDIMKAADQLRYETVGDVVTYIMNANINYTNICSGSCQFCAFSVGPKNPKAYFMTPKEVAEKTVIAKKEGLTEVCIQGGINDKVDTYYQESILKEIRKATDPLGGIMIHAFSPMDIVTGAENAGLDTKSAIKILKEAGLDTIPGTAAEILVDDLRKELCSNKVSVDEWIKTIKQAHNLGIKSTSTMMYGHIETSEDRTKHLKILRDIQKDTNGFTEFILLPYLNDNTGFQKRGILKSSASGQDDMKVTAISRLFFKDLIPNIQIPWVKLGVKFGQVCLNCGGNDFSGSMFEDDISESAGASYGTYMTREMYKDAIEKIGRIPKERNTLYEYV
ncbi:MAG: 7,8-didemethyl-8-hydroxy-5-deazariboflavin synthase subunit CofH [Methanosarcinaceae archaeon]|nr:7,8-didemethyl-8-hydroxy-5-deazariboflavin synthase subunit CofH [Methanosarcinaceae archaeon]